MSKKSKAKAQASYERTDNDNERSYKWLYIVIAIALVISITLVIVFATVDGAKRGNQNEAGDLVISKSDIKEKVSIYKVKIDGVKVEVLVGLTSDGQIRTAFNACANTECKESNKGHFKVKGDTVTCKNCGRSFTLDDFNTEIHGSKPVTIPVSQRKETENSILIPISVLQNNVSLFQKTSSK